MLQTVLMMTVICALGLTFVLAGFMFGWKGHEFWMKKTGVQAQVTKEEEADSLYRTKDGKFYTHKITRVEDD